MTGVTIDHEIEQTEGLFVYMRKHLSVKPMFE